MSTQHYTLLIIGGGAAGVSVANNMRRQNAKIGIAIVEPSESIITNRASPLLAVARIP